MTRQESRTPPFPHLSACSWELEQRGVGSARLLTQPSLWGQRTFLRRTFVVLLTGGRQVSFLFESECCWVEDIPVVLHLTTVPGSSWLNPFGRCNLSSHCHLMGSVHCGGTKVVSYRKGWFLSGITSCVTR